MVRNHGRAHSAPCVRPRHVHNLFACTCTGFAGWIRRAPPPTFSDTAVTDRHSYTTIIQPRAYWVRISWSIGSEKSFGHVPPVGVAPSTPCVNGVPPEPQRNVSMTTVRGAVRPSISVYTYFRKILFPVGFEF